MLNKYEIQTNYSEVKTWINSVLKNYLTKNKEDVGEIEHIIDYFNFRADKFEKKGKPLRLKKMSYIVALEKSRQWVHRQNKKAASIVETESDVEEVAKLNNDLRLIKLIGENAYKREGRLMSHCVGSYYGKNVDVYSIRDYKNNPHCTIEVNKDSTNQIKGKGNGSIHPKYIDSVLKALKILDKPVKKSEMIYLGYREIDKNVFKFYMSNFKNFKYMTYDSSIFMYVNQTFCQD